MRRRPRAPRPRTGDRVTISFKGSINGELFDGGTGEGIPVVIGAGQFIPGFEEQLVGIGVGETRTLKVSFPKNYASEKLAGQPAEFETTATLIEAPGETKIDDEFAKTLGLESLDKLKEAARERLVAEFAGATRQRVKRALLDRLDDSHKFEAPPSLIEEEFNLMWNSIKAEMESSAARPLPTRTPPKRPPRKNTRRSPTAASGSASCCRRSARRTRSP